LKSYIGIERGAPGRDVDNAWDALLDGDVTRAHGFLARAAPPTRQEILVAASDGADPAWAERIVSQLPDAAWSDDALMFAAALAMRSHQDGAPYWALLEQRPRLQPQRIRQFLQDVQAGGWPRDDLVGMSLAARGQAYSMALVVRGKPAPQVWRDGAKRLLFKVERPYFD